MSAHRTRRELLRPPRATDPTRLARLLALESMAVDAYTLALLGGRLSPATAKLARQIRRQEAEHAAALTHHVPASLVPDADDGSVATSTALQRELAGAGIHVHVARVHGEAGWIRLLERIEGALAAAHFRAVRELRDPVAATLVATILGDEAQHQTVLSRLRHPHNVVRAVPFSVVPADASIQL